MFLSMTNNLLVKNSPPEKPLKIDCLLCDHTSEVSEQEKSLGSDPKNTVSVKATLNQFLEILLSLVCVRITKISRYF